MFYKFEWSDTYIEERKDDTFLKGSTAIPYDSLIEVDAEEFYCGRNLKEIGLVCISNGKGSFISLPFIAVKDNGNGYISISDFKEKLINKKILDGCSMYLMYECTILKSRGLWGFGDYGNTLD